MRKEYRYYKKTYNNTCNIYCIFVLKLPALTILGIIQYKKVRSELKN